jgi:hypothetical protein
MTPPIKKSPENTGFGGRIAWFGAGFVLPFYSLEYYLGAMRKPLRSALLFFFALMTLAAGLTTAHLGRTIDSFRRQTLEAFEAGELPVITIADGNASVEGEDPFLIKDGSRYFFAVDTTSALDRDQFLNYGGGILITKTQQYSYQNGRSQAIALENYNLGFGLDPIVIDGTLANEFFGAFSIYFLIAAGLLVWIWDTAVWLAFLSISAYFLWGPIHQALPDFSYRAVLSIGIYAHLPALVINHILTLFGVQTIFIYTTLLLTFWVGALFLILREITGGILITTPGDQPPQIKLQIKAPPPRLWPAWLGLPVMVFIAANAVFTWEFAPLYVLGGTAVTIAALLFIDARHHPQTEENAKSG